MGSGTDGFGTGFHLTDGSSARAGFLEVGGDLCQSSPRFVEVGVGAELAFGGDAAHGAWNQLGDFCHAVGVDADVRECVLTGLEPALSPGGEFGGGAWVELFEFGVIAWQGRAEVLDGSGVGGSETFVEGVDDCGDTTSANTSPLLRE